MMVKAATGGGGGNTEPLPIVFIVPKLLPSALDRACSSLTGYFPYSLLGYGDAGVPGLLVALCLKFDMTHRPRSRCRIYFWVAGLGEWPHPLLCTQRCLPAGLPSCPCSLLPGSGGHLHRPDAHGDSPASTALFGAHHPGFSDSSGSVS